MAKLKRQYIIDKIISDLERVLKNHKVVVLNVHPFVNSPKVFHHVQNGFEHKNG
jgi:predicted nucleotide-binding protein (sugar kinase/HSP70/actin superfamily)